MGFQLNVAYVIAVNIQYAAYGLHIPQYMFFPHLDIAIKSLFISPFCS